MHKSETEKIDSILDEHQQIYRRHNRINNILGRIVRVLHGFPVLLLRSALMVYI